MTGGALVTGAGGFIGSHLVASLLDAGRPVRGLDVSLDAVRHLAQRPGLELVEADIADEAAVHAALDGVDVVHHLAAAHLGARIAEHAFRAVNVDATRALAGAAASRGVRRFVHCSSVGVFGPIAAPPANEETPCRPELAYERTKLEGERAVLETCRERGLDAVVVRPAWVYGPGCPRTRKLIEAIRRGRFVVAGAGGGLRHCLFVADCVTAFRLAEDAPEAAGRVIILGDDRPVTIRELVDTIARLTGARPPRAIPVALFAALATLAELAFAPLRREPPLSRRTLRFFDANTAFDTTRARRLLGFRPAYDLERGLSECVRALGEGGAWRAGPAGRAAS